MIERGYLTGCMHTRIRAARQHKRVAFPTQRMQSLFQLALHRSGA